MAELKFESNELTQYMAKIEQDSKELIKKIILKESPIQVGDKVQIRQHGAELEWVEVAKISIKAVAGWGRATEKLSFSYRGTPLTKKMKPMKRRNPIEFDRFIKDGQDYSVLSCYCVEIEPAKMYQNR